MGRERESPKRGFWKDNGLSLCFLGLFLLCLLGDGWTGFYAFNSSQTSHALATVSLGGFLRTGTFLDGIFVNWQAAVLQLAALIYFGSVLFQRGATHSRKPEGADGGKEAAKADGEAAKTGKRGEDEPKEGDGGDGRSHGWLYRNSLTLAFMAIFVVSFLLHMLFGTWAYNEQQQWTRAPQLGVLAFTRSAQFWTSTLKCWQAEMFAIFAYVVFSIFFRQQNSPESKPVHASDGETGEANK